MIKTILICDSQGYPFYMKQIDPTMTEMDSSIFSGLISAISTIGKQLFNEDIATITYGDKYKITIITKELISYQKTIYFVFLLEGAGDLKLMRRLSTNIFIETKSVLKDPSAAKLDIKHKVDKILANL